MKVWLVALAACGRIDFAPVAMAMSGDDIDAPATPGDGAIHDASGGDAALSGCAVAIGAGLGVSTIQNSCDPPAAGLACGSAGTKAQLYSFKATTAGSYTFKALDATDNNITNHSVAVLDATCTMKTTCSGIYGTSLSAGETIYFSVGSDVGGCAMYRVSITSP